ncbi:MAG: lipid-A-disaccharide synthase [Phycisphaerales bacterium]|nr:lipid-A-disaccharide synthase [Phycisphaerales bacterium]
MPSRTAKRIFITAAEASGDQHAAELVRSLKQLDPAIEFEGLGGPKMAAAGVKLLAETVGRAAMGWRGALRVVEASGWMKRVSARYHAAPPDLHICVDSSAINLPLARRAKRFGVPVLYYIAPQLWASREWRMKKLRRLIDRLAVIFPFEEEYFRSHGVNATFVGHPLFDELPADRTRDSSPRFPDAPPVVGIIPGSRRSEVKANLPHLIDVMRHITAEFPKIKFLVPTTAASNALVKQTLAAAPLLDVTVDQDAFDRLIPRCDLVLTKSGTSTVHVAAWRVPMIVVYRMSPLIWHGAARWLLHTKKIAMVNILAGQIDLVPEFIPWYGSNQPVIDCALDLLKNPAKLRAQREKLDTLIKAIEKPGASMNVARLALSMINKESA